MPRSRRTPPKARLAPTAAQAAILRSLLDETRNAVLAAAAVVASADLAAQIDNPPENARFTLKVLALVMKGCLDRLRNIEAMAVTVLNEQAHTSALRQGR